MRHRRPAAGYKPREGLRLSLPLYRAPHRCKPPKSAEAVAREHADGLAI
jgi:hypothetical protein